MSAGRLRRFGPSSLVGQILLTVAMALLLAQAVNFALLLRERDRQIFQQASEPAIERLIGAVQGPSERRSARIRRWSSIDTTSQVSPAMRARPDIADRARDAFADRGVAVLQVQAAVGEVEPGSFIARRLKERRDNERRERAERGDRRPVGRNDRDGDPRALIISAEVTPGRWVTSYGLIPDRQTRLIIELLFQTVILYAVVMAAVWLVVRRIARPLKELTVAAESFDPAGAATALEPRGPADIRHLMEAFEAMQVRIRAMLAEKDHMLGAIGHDLRTPLASLRVRAESVDDEDERNRMAQTIDEMNRTLDDILSLARLGRPSEPPTKVDLSALVDAAVEDFRDLGHDVAFEPGARVTAAVRTNLIKRAVRNLIENALKYGEQVEVALDRAEDGVVIEIADRGPGIPEGAIERMFEPFTRLEGSRSRETGGAGLGLTLARAIATGHGGSLTLANRPEGGLVARLWVPA
ncbi:signal transduction histidine kinase [Sphingomonas zeicaulis]|uniref:sensor histidine kinase n=1 Tax=Sphingomonas zeicaulis TaxID=1632740 RepID=UPI003D262B2E